MAILKKTFLKTMTVKEKKKKCEAIYVLGKVDKVVCKFCDYRGIDPRILGVNTAISL